MTTPIKPKILITILIISKISFSLKSGTIPTKEKILYRNEVIKAKKLIKKVLFLKRAFQFILIKTPPYFVFSKLFIL